MKSIEEKLNEALDKLKTISASKYKEVCEKLPTLFPNVEAQVQCVAEALKQFTQESNPLGLQGFELLEEAKREFPALFGVEPRTDGAKPITEAGQRTVNKHNGAADNFVEGSPFNEGRNAASATTESDPIIQMKEASVERLKKTGLSEADARGILGLAPKQPEGLTRRQAAEYTFAIRCGISESDALKLVKI
ncbi:MAG: hypothetical protein ABSE82_15505 [Nitrososphaerales archaeon]